MTSAVFTTEQVTSPDSPNKWDSAALVPAKPADSDYGYFIEGKPVKTTREQLVDRVESGLNPSFVWTPESAEPVRPERVSFLLGSFRRSVHRSARNAILTGTGIALFPIALAFALNDWTLVYRSFWFVIGAVVIAEGIWQYVRARHYTQDDAVSDATSVRFTAWLKKQKLSGYTAALVAYICIVGIFQSFTDNSIEAAGLVKPAVWQGEIWRLFTATLMHANLTHFWMNSLVLLHFARLVEHTVQRACVPLVFLLTSVIGSIFSVLLYPNSTSVGASGGLMGLLGFITIAAYFDRTRYPQRYFRQMIEAIVLVGVLGLLGFAFIDNAAHFGGLFGGLLLGWFLLRRNAQRALERERLFKFGGVAALIVLCLVAAFAVCRILN